MTASSAAPPHWITDDHRAFADSLARFVAREITPYADQWDEAGEFPRELYAKAAAVGMIGMGYPEEYGGYPADRFTRIIAARALAQAGSGGVAAGLMSHSIGAPPIARLGTPEIKARFLPGILSGELISALAVTEPGGGSDVAGLTTSARREGDEFVVNGEKTFITSGMRADVYTVAVRTGGPGMGGISMLLIERDRPGFTRTALRKTGWWASDTATLHFDNVRVPAENLIGAENAGFMGIMVNFNDERLGLATSSLAFSRVAYDDALEWARMRQTFGRPLIERQVIRHKLVDMLQRISAGEAWLHSLAWRLDQGEQPVAELCMLKNHSTQTMAFCASEAVQILGGAGFMRGGRIERIAREVKVNAIGGGAEEIMKDLCSRQLGY